MTQVKPFLMFDDQLEAAAAFYVATFPGTEAKLTRAGKDGPVVSGELTLGGQTFLAYNGGSYFRFSEAFSLFVTCADQAEVDLYWDKLVAAGATPSQCGWITDPFGLSWQIVPRRFLELMGDKNRAKAQAVVAAMMQMTKFDVAALERAYAEA